jgi:hypothetical protein
MATTQTKYGLGQVIETFNNNQKQSIPTVFTPVRVTDIVLDDKHPEFESLGSWNGIGTIKYQLVYESTVNNDPKQNLSAKSLFPNLKYYPLKNEIVWIISLPSSDTQDNNNISNYYVYPINIWNNQHHNALPDISNPDNVSSNTNLDYTDTGNGIYRRINDDSSDIDLGKTFKEKLRIHPLLPYEGDMIIEGRWGNSIRLGSTVRSNISNLWSKNGDEGNPIIILRNGQSSDLPKEGWIPQLEDINKDKSSIYITNNQTIPIQVASTNQKSFNQQITPTNITQPVINNTTSTQPPTQPTPTPTPQPAAPITTTPAASSNPNTFNEDSEEFSPFGDTGPGSSFGGEDPNKLNSVVEEVKPEEKTAATEDSNKGFDKDKYELFYSVKHEAQPANSNWCAVTATSIVLNYYDANTNQKVICQWYTGADNRKNKTTPTLTRNIEWKSAFADKYDVTSLKSKYPGGLTYIRENLGKYSAKLSTESDADWIKRGENELHATIVSRFKSLQRPLILQVRSMGDKNDSEAMHFVVVNGLDTNGNLIINDPGKNKGSNIILLKSRLRPWGTTLDHAEIPVTE